MKQFINANTIANDMRMRRTVFHGTFLLVEGDGDERFFRLLVRRDVCQIVICFGVENLTEACTILEGINFAGFLGIADADFMHAEGRFPELTNLLHTDLHDIECMMLRGQAFDRIIQEFADEAKLHAWQARHRADIRTHLLEQSAIVGFLLWLSLREGLDLKLDDIEAKEYIQRDTLATDRSRLVTHVKNRSRRHDLSDERLLDGMAERQSINPDFWQIARGHDVVELLTYALRFVWGNDHSLTRDYLEKCLRLAYPLTEFSETYLYQSIIQWQERNSPFVVVSALETRE